MRDPRHVRRWLAGGALLLLTAACSIESEQPELGGTTVRLTVLRTSDIHSRLFPYDLKPNSHDEGDGLYGGTAPYGGVERIAGLIHRERERGQRVVYLDSGDIFQGAPIFNFSQGEPEFRWLSTAPTRPASPRSRPTRPCGPTWSS
jgi:5'-nucleotidase/UDP-sugar diphosphatase